MKNIRTKDKKYLSDAKKASPEQKIEIKINHWPGNVACIKIERFRID